MEKQYRTTPRQTNLAYDLYSSRATRSRTEGQDRILREEAPKPRTKAKTGISFSYLFCVAAAAALLIVAVSSYARLTELNVKASALENELGTLELEHAGILAARDKKLNTAELAEYARTHLGMMQSGTENVEYIVLGTEDEIIVTGGGKSTAAETVREIWAFVDGIIEYFR